MIASLLAIFYLDVYINGFLRPSEAEMLYRDNCPNRDRCKRFFDNNLQTYTFRALKMSWVPTYSTIAVICNPIKIYLRPSEAEKNNLDFEKIIQLLMLLIIQLSM